MPWQPAILIRTRKLTAEPDAKLQDDPKLSKRSLSVFGDEVIFIAILWKTLFKPIFATAILAADSAPL
jgi:hypothetical protein